MKNPKLDNSKNNGMLVGEKLHMQNLCETCMWRGLGSCPSARSTADEDWHDFPQIIDGENTAGIVKVLKCKDFEPKKRQKVKAKNKVFVWDSKTRQHIEKK